MFQLSAKKSTFMFIRKFNRYFRAIIFSLILWFRLILWFQIVSSKFYSDTFMFCVEVIPQIFITILLQRLKLWSKSANECGGTWIICSEISFKIVPDFLQLCTLKINSFNCLDTNFADSKVYKYCRKLNWLILFHKVGENCSQINILSQKSQGWNGIDRICLFLRTLLWPLRRLSTCYARFSTKKINPANCCVKKPH